MGSHPCKTCRWEAYGPAIPDAIDCCHPVTLAKKPAWTKGDPVMVSWRTADVNVARDGHELMDCPTYEAAGWTRTAGPCEPKTEKEAASDG